MAINQSDISIHSNPNLAVVDSDFLKGGFRTAVATVNDLYALSGKTDEPSASGQLKEFATIVYVSGETKYYILKDVSNVDNASGWEEFQTGGGGEGTITGATNGLSLANSGTTVILGGTLTGTTIINVGDSDFQVGTTGLTPTLIGVDASGITMSFSGNTSVSLESVAGLTYEGNYRTGFTEYSLPDAGYVTGLTNVYLKLDQTTPQNVTGSQPVFDEGLSLGPTPSASQISGHTVGKMYYDIDYETVSINIGTDTGHQPNIQLGQEMYRYVYNASGDIIPNGAVVQELGVHTGGPGTDVPTITMAIASGSTNDVLGVATEVFGTGVTNSYGFITTIGYIHDINTSTGSQFSGMTEGDHLYLSPTVLGGLTNIEPTTPNKAIHVGMLITKDVTNGKIYVDIHPALSLNDLLDVSVPAPTTNYVLTWNGVDWVDAAAGSTSAGSGVNFYYATPIINAITPPAGLSQDGTAGNGIQVATFSRTPVTSGGTVTVAGLDGVSTRAFAAWGQDDEIGRTTIDSGLWEFYDYVYVSTIVGTTYLIHGVYQVVPITGSTITVTGASANSRTAIITSGEFTGEYYNPDVTNTQASYLQTEGGIFQITASASTNQVTITVPTGYVNEAAVTGSTWNPLFTGSTESIEHLVTELYQTKIVAPAFNINLTDRLGQILFVESSGTYTLTLNYNGTSAASFVITPFVTLHNDLPGLQGGTGDERFHIDEAEAVVVGNTSGINTGDNAGLVSTHWHDYSVITNTPDLSVYETVDNFTGYTATTEQILTGITEITDVALTGATNVGGGSEVYSGQTGRTSVFRTIVGSGDTSVTTVGNEIIINSEGTNSCYNLASPSTVCVGGIPATTILTGKTAFELFEEMLVVYLPPAFSSFSNDITTTVEVGCIISGSSSFSWGFSNASNVSGSSMCICDITAASMLATNISTTSPQSETITTNEFTSCGEQQQWSGHAQNTCATPFNSSTRTVTALLPWYWGLCTCPGPAGANRPTADCNMVLSGAKTLLTSAGNVSPPFNSTADDYLWFAVPSTVTDKTCWCLNASIYGTIGGGIGAGCNLFPDPVAAVPVTTSCWSANYDVYISNKQSSTSTLKMGYA